MVTLLAMLVPPSRLVLPLFIEIKTLGLFDSPWAVMLTMSFFPFGTFLAYIFYATSIPKELYEAAKIDGCDEYQTFWRVARPLAKPLIAILAFFRSSRHGRTTSCRSCCSGGPRTTPCRWGSASCSQRHRR